MTAKNHHPFWSGLLLLPSLFLLSSCLSMSGISAAEPPPRYWIMSIEEWNSVSVNMYENDDNTMANALRGEGWDIFRLTDVGIVLKKTNNIHDVRIISVDKWNETAENKHRGNDTDMANALAQEGWEITDMSIMGVLLKRTRIPHQVRIFEFDEWNRFTEREHKSSDTEAMNSLADQGWSMVQISQLGVVLQQK